MKTSFEMSLNPRSQLSGGRGGGWAVSEQGRVQDPVVWRGSGGEDECAGVFLPHLWCPKERERGWLGPRAPLLEAEMGFGCSSWDLFCP